MHAYVDSAYTYIQLCQLCAAHVILAWLWMISTSLLALSLFLVVVVVVVVENFRHRSASAWMFTINLETAWIHDICCLWPADAKHKWLTIWTYQKTENFRVKRYLYNEFLHHFTKLLYFERKIRNHSSGLWRSGNISSAGKPLNTKFNHVTYSLHLSCWEDLVIPNLVI